MHEIVPDDAKLLSGFPWPINGNQDNNLESLSMLLTFKILMEDLLIGW
jgi:hypothetical protein